LNLSLLLKSFTYFRLLILCLIDNKGVFQIVLDFSCSNKLGKDIHNPDKIIFVSRVSQLLASVPDKARLGASAALTSPYPFPLWRSILFLPCCMLCCSAPTNHNKKNWVKTLFAIYFCSLSFSNSNNVLLVCTCNCKCLTQTSSFFKHVVSQLLDGAEAATIELATDEEANEHCVLSSMFHFVGEVLSRVCRRGSAGEY